MDTKTKQREWQLAAIDVAQAEFNLANMQTKLALAIERRDRIHAELRCVRAYARNPELFPSQKGPSQ